MDDELIRSVQAVCVTACGNYAIAGSSTGQIRGWNLQSGHERRVFNLAGVTQPTQKSRNLARGKAVRVGKSVTGLATDALNRCLIASTLDGNLNVGYCLRPFNHLTDLILAFPSSSISTPHS
jgi:U3 small nucleolar RNA-associated protein 21